MRNSSSTRAVKLSRELSVLFLRRIHCCRWLSTMRCGAAHSSPGPAPDDRSGKLFRWTFSSRPRRWTRHASNSLRTLYRVLTRAKRRSIVRERSDNRSDDRARPRNVQAGAADVHIAIRSLRATPRAAPRFRRALPRHLRFVGCPAARQVPAETIECVQPATSARQARPPIFLISADGTSRR